MPSDNTTNFKIAVAMSGGVDSSVVAALLKEQGHDVIGLTMLLQKTDDPSDARDVASRLSIPLHVIDCTEAFSTCVIEPFARSYLSGQTPIPCINCNKSLKFGCLIDEAKKLGVQALATGHYAQIKMGPSGVELHRGDDLARDQSYFLASLTQEQLSFSRFPLSAMSKNKTRDIAREFSLPIADKKDSQDICFVPNGDYVSVLQKLHPDACKPGKIVDEEGHELSCHEGIIHFTVGQRKGLNISDRKGENNEPLFVLRLDAEKREVVVGPREALAKSIVHLKEMNWIAPDINVGTEGLLVQVRLRSTQKLQEARFFMEAEGKGRVELLEPVYGVSPGQAGVIYDGSRVLGSGWIIGAA